MGFNLQDYLSNNPLFEEKEELEDGGPEEKEFDSEFNALADELAGAIEDELKDKEEKLDESIVATAIGALGYILLSNTVANMMAKFAQKMSKKYNWGKGEEVAKNLYKWTHDNEKAFQAPLRRVVGLFTKDKKKQDQIASVLYAIMILMMAGQAGGDAASYLRKASWFKGSFYTLKSLIKGKEVHAIFKNVLSDIAG